MKNRLGKIHEKPYRVAFPTLVRPRVKVKNLGRAIFPPSLVVIALIFSDIKCQ